MNPNNFSYWFPKVKDCGLPVPKTYWKKLPTLEEDFETANRLKLAFFAEDLEPDKAAVQKWLNEEVIRELKEMRLDGQVFVKNARFSNKFWARGSCIIRGLDELAAALIEINYGSMCCGAGGSEELIVREFIGYDRYTTPCVYNGLPLRPEFRVFYDFDKKAVIFVENYWKWEYCYPNLYDATDRIIFNHERGYLEDFFGEHKARVAGMVHEAMQNVEDLTGQWSVDIMYDKMMDIFWLIDMAVAQNSAYWENRPDKEAYP